MNTLLGAIAVVMVFGWLLLVERYFKKEGVFVFMAVASITANILICKSINILGLSATLGNVLFASNFLATDILSEKYGVEHSKKATKLAVMAVLMFVGATQMALLFIPNEFDIANGAMEALFTLSLRTSLVSITLFFLSNMADIYLFELIKKKIPGKLWLRNNVATIVANCTENFLFYGIAFYGIMDWKTIFACGLTATIIEFIVAICDTPFLYLATKEKRKEELASC